MAQSNKSRMVIWTIVGILVVVAVVFLVMGKKDSDGGKPVDVPKFTRLMTTRIDKVEANAAELRGEYGPDADEHFAKIDAHIERSRHWLGQLQTAGDREGVDEARDSIYAGYHAVKKLVQELK